MANQLKKKFIGLGEVGADQILIESGKSLKAQTGEGTVDLLKVTPEGQVLVKGEEVGLKSAIDTEKARIDAILAASSADKDSFAEIVQLINSVDTANDNAFAAYVLSNDAALAAEVSARTSADQALQSEVDAVESALAQEIQDRTDADAMKANKAGDTITGDYTFETNTSNSYTRISADNGINIYGDGPQNVDAYLYADVNTGEFFVEATKLRFYASEISVNSAKIKNVGAGSVSTDAVNKGQLDYGVAEAKTYADAAVLVEKGRAETAESALDARLDILEALEHKKFKKVLLAGDISAGYVDLPHLAVAGSTVAFVDRLAIHEGAQDDYSVSTVGGVTRITFQNDLVQPGQSALSAGDTLFVKYVK